MFEKLKFIQNVAPSSTLWTSLLIFFIYIIYFYDIVWFVVCEDMVNALLQVIRMNNFGHTFYESLCYLWRILHHHPFAIVLVHCSGVLPSDLSCYVPLFWHIQHFQHKSLGDCYVNGTPERETWYSSRVDLNTTNAQYLNMSARWFQWGGLYAQAFDWAQSPGNYCLLLLSIITIYVNTRCQKITATDTVFFMNDSSWLWGQPDL